MQKILRIYLICFSLSNLITDLRSQTFAWAKTLGNLESFSVSRDNSGNVITTGIFQNTVDFDPGPGTYTLSAKGSYDIFIVKLDASGNFIWAGSLGGTGVDYVRESIIDAVGNVFIVGSFASLVDFDPGPGTFTLNSVNGSAYLTKLDANGNFILAKQFGEDATGIDLDATGNIYISGTFSGTSDLDPGPGTYSLTSAGFQDALVLKLDPSGNFIWAKQLGGPKSENTYAIRVDASGNIYSTGTFWQYGDYDPGPATFILTALGLDIFLSKLDASGNFVFAKQISAPGSGQCNDIKIDASGNIYLTGQFNGTTDFDLNGGTLNLTPVAFDDIFVAKYDQNSNIYWAINLGGSYSDGGYSLDLDALGNIYSTGYFEGVVDFDPGLGTFTLTTMGTASADAYINILDNSGNFIWTGQLGGYEYYIQGNSIDVDPAGTTIYSAGKLDMGTTYTFCDMDPGPATYTILSFSSAYVHKLNNSGMGVNENIETGTEVGPNPFSNSINVNLEKNISDGYYSIYNMVGQVIVDNTAFSSNMFSIDLSDIPNGMYILEIRFGNKAERHKILKE